MIIQGRLLLNPEHRPPLGWLRIENGRIAEFEEGSPPGRVDAGGPDRLITPGFIDAHIHLPQVERIGHDGLPLLEWLDRVIFPAEQRWRDVEAATRDTHLAVERMISTGTLGFAGYLTSHDTGFDATTRVMTTTPLRAIAGRVLMDRAAPDELIRHEWNEARLTPDESAARLEWSVNPRFAIACGDPTLRRAARVAGDEGRWIQTHLAETPDERRRVLELFPDDEHYTGVYDRCGLLGPRTILAHAIHLGPGEWDLIAERQCVIAHCPTANLFLSAGLFDLRAARDRGIRVVLGSDVAAGPDFSMPRVARGMIEVAKMRRLTLDERAVVPTPAEAWKMITLGAAEALGWNDGGRLDAGAAADLLVLRTSFDLDDEALIGRLLYEWSPKWIEHPIVHGAPVSQDGRSYE